MTIYSASVHFIERHIPKINMNQKGVFLMSLTTYSVSKEAIYAHIVDKVVALFELERDELCLESKLYEDLDIDSIDAVDLLIEIKKSLNLDLRPEQFKGASTFGEMVEIIYHQQETIFKHA